VNGDTKLEVDEAFTVDLSNPTNSVTISDAQGLGTITNDDAASYSINDVTQAETDSGTTTFTFTVTLDAAVAGGTSVDYTTNDATATIADSDYVAASGTLNFTGTVGETQTIDVTVNGDTKLEADETFTVDLSNPTNSVTISDAQGLGTITNDDAASFSIDDVTLNEGDAGTTTYTFTVTLDAAVAGGTNVDFTTTDGTATIADSDYVAASGTLNFAGTAGETQTVDVTVNGDTKLEVDEAFTVDLSNPTNAVTISDAQGVGALTNDDAASFSVDDVTLNEGDAGTTIYTFTVTLDAAVAGGTSVDYTTTDGTATTADSDYVATSGTLNFTGTAGETQTIDVTVNGDTTLETDETFTVDLSNPTNSVTISDAQGVGTLTNDDAASYSIDDVTLNEGDAGTTIYTFTVTLDAAVAGGTSVDYTTTDSSATTADSDYVATSGTLNFTGTAGETQTVDVTVNGDTKLEADETFTVDLSNPTNSVTISDAQGVGTLTNDDAASFSIDDVTLNEGDAGTTTYTFTVTLDDYVAASGTLNFTGTAGETQTVDVTVNGDTTLEADETFTVDLSNPTNSVTISDAEGVGTITNDDAASYSIDDVTLNEGDAGTTTYTFTVTLDEAVAGGTSVDYTTNMARQRRPTVTTLRLAAH
jgi:hypothetical protein